MAATNYEFPGWECGQHNAVVGAMRASGFRSSSGAAVVFEQFEYALNEGYLQSTAYCFATFPLTDWVTPGNGPVLNLRVDEQRRSPLSFGEIPITSRGRSFTLPFTRNDLISEGYMDASVQRPSGELLVFRASDVLPRDWLFSEPDHLKRAFAMQDDAVHLFSIDQWRHLSFEELYGEAAVMPSTVRDIVAMAEAACHGSRTVQLEDVPNTSWRIQCRRGEK